MEELSANSKILSQSSLIHIANKALQKDKVFHIRYKTEQENGPYLPVYLSLVARYSHGVRFFLTEDGYDPAIKIL